MFMGCSICVFTWRITFASTAQRSAWFGIGTSVTVACSR